MPNTQANVNAQTLKFVQTTGAFAKRAIEENTTHTSQQKAAADLVEVTLDMCKKANVVDEGDHDRCRELLSKHASTIELLQQAVTKIAELQGQIDKQAAIEPGTGDSQKSASADSGYNSLEDPVVGRRTSQKKASDEALLRGLDIAS